MYTTIKTILFSSLTLILFSGCFLQSVHPLVSHDNSILVPELEGIWEGKNDRWTFIHDPKKFSDLEIKGLDFELDENEPLPEEKIYFAIYENFEPGEEEVSFFIVTAGLFNGNYFIDLSIYDEMSSENFKSGFYFPVHVFTKASIENDNLRMEFFKEEWIKDMISENKVRIKHEKVDNSILLTASTDDLRKFIEKYSDDERAFEKPSTFTRVK